MTYTPKWVGSKPMLGIVDLMAIDANPGLGTPGVAVLPSVPMAAQFGEIVTGWDPLLGSGEFIYLQGVASLVAGDVVSYNALTGATTRWAGTANTGWPLAVALSNPLAGQNGWFQIAGNAIATCTGTVAAGDSAYFSATAALKSAAAAGKQVLGCQAVLANGGTISGSNAVGATQAVYTIQRPFAQGAIT